MAVIDFLNPMKYVTPKFTEEQLSHIVEYFDSKAQPLLTINDGEPINVISIENLIEYLSLAKFHRRNFHYPSYAEIMNEVEKLKIATTFRVLTQEQFIYLLNLWVLEPDLKHELILAFKVFDTEKRNFLDLDVLKSIVTSFGDVFNEEETRELLRDANFRGDGNVFYEEFVESIFSRAPELYEEKAEYLYEDPDEDPSVPPLPEPEPELEPEPEKPPVVEEQPPVPPPQKKEKKKK